METAYDCHIEQIVQSIFSTMLNMNVTRVEQNFSRADDSLAVTIQITGKWIGSVVLDLSPEAARASAAAMFQSPSEEIAQGDEHEVAVELVNMIGGNLKSLLPGPSHLSLPTVVSGRDFGLRVHDAELIEDVALGCDAGLLRVRLYEKI